MPGLRVLPGVLLIPSEHLIEYSSRSSLSAQCAVSRTVTQAGLPIQSGFSQLCRLG